MFESSLLLIVYCTYCYLEPYISTRGVVAIVKILEILEILEIYYHHTVT
jgi:hypothetical protein